MSPLRRLARVMVAFLLVTLVGTVGYVILGFGVLDALYQTVTTISTVGFREVHPLSPLGQVFTMALILVGAGTVFYMFGVLLEALIDGHLRHRLERRRMNRQIARMRGHVIVCGWGRVGRSTAQYLSSLGRAIVVIDRDPDRLDDIEFAYVLGDVTDDSVLGAAGIEHAHAMIAALDSDADNVYVTLSARSQRPDLVIVARAGSDNAKAMLHRAGANRAINPQLIGGRRMAAFALQPNVAEFLDVVMHDDALEYRIEEITIGSQSPLDGRSLADAAVRPSTGALVLALRTPGGRFVANPADDTAIIPGTVLIILGTPTQLAAVRGLTAH
ncbi:TrkA family potassium uptake protein [Nocardia sp. BMG51109]|uniref:potassium channel family protein n=1 Tax=Nocardia sp. BMG51109 TaxID=1056816 RepID=UPI0004634DEF|nr:potassium channel protein [Nocardia sp. BMG51109]